MNIQNHNHQTMHGNNPLTTQSPHASCIITSAWRRCYKIGSHVSIQVFIIKKKTQNPQNPSIPKR
jgi:hypothetical protein